jgi:DNA-directed RNA polymerase sigma subunit (sigma70/sigma32)
MNRSPALYWTAEREAQLIEDRKTMTLDALAEKYHVSPARISQVLKRAKERLKPGLSVKSIGA